MLMNEHIDSLMEAAEYKTFHKVFDKQCIVVAKFPSGFTIVGESACIDHKNYDEKIGFDIAKSRIENRLWELEGYLASNNV